MIGGLNPAQVRDLIVRPSLRKLGLPGGEPVEKLIMGTGAHESDGFRELKQVGGGPALSLWQIEPATALDAIARLPVAVRLALETLRIGPMSFIDQLPGNLYLGAGLCRAIYFLKPFRLGELGAAEPEKLARVWKVYWNTLEGAGTEAEFLGHYQAMVAPLYPS